jgi:hypothetical protein
MSAQKSSPDSTRSTSSLRQRPETVTEIYLDAERSDARAKDLRELAKRLNVRLISADMKRLDGMAGGVRHQGVIAHAEPLDTPKFIEDVLEGDQRAAAPPHPRRRAGSAQPGRLPARGRRRRRARGDRAQGPQRGPHHRGGEGGSRARRNRCRTSW